MSRRECRWPARVGCTKQAAVGLPHDGMRRAHHRLLADIVPLGFEQPDRVKAEILLNPQLIGKQLVVPTHGLGQSGSPIAGVTLCRFSLEERTAARSLEVAVA